MEREKKKNHEATVFVPVTPKGACFVLFLISVLLCDINFQIINVTHKQTKLVNED